MFTEPIHRDAIQFAQLGKGHSRVPFGGLSYGSQHALFRRFQHHFQVRHNPPILQLFKGTKDWKVHSLAIGRSGGSRREKLELRGFHHGRAARANWLGRTGAFAQGIDLARLCSCAAEKSAVPIFRRMLVSHERSLSSARGHSEPAGQIAAREMEIVRIKGALQRAEELSDDVAAGIERAL
jgi:hypothetical protein